jgi:hypothetical protein
MVADSAAAAAAAGAASRNARTNARRSVAAPPTLPRRPLRLPLELRVRLGQCAVGPAPLLDQRRLVHRRGQLLAHHAHQRPLLVGDLRLAGEVEGDRARGAVAAHQRCRHDRAEPELPRDVVPFGRRRIGEDVLDLDHPPLGHRGSARPAPDPDAQRPDPPPVHRRPFVLCHRPQQFPVRIEAQDQRERRPQQRRHPVECELVHVVRAVRLEERMGDLADRQQFAQRNRRFGPDRRTGEWHPLGRVDSGHQVVSADRGSDEPTVGPGGWQRLTAADGG